MTVGTGVGAEYEAIVVGTGFGGAATACRLAQCGFRVLVLERGRRYEAGDFPALPTTSALLPDTKRWTWGETQGLWDILDLEELVSVQAAGYGGGSLIYANVHLRPPAEVFDSAWPAAYRRGTALEPHFNLAGYMLDVAPIDAHRKLTPSLVKAEQLRRVAGELGRQGEFFHPPLAVSSKTGPNVHGFQQSECNGCGRCCTGCPQTAKNTLDHNYLALAERHGAETRTQVEVTDIEELGDNEWVVCAFDHLAAQRRSYRAKYVFLCAGSVHTTRLLARARLRSASAQQNVGIGYFPGGDALGVVYDTKEPQYPSFGPAITTTMAHWTDGAPGSFFLLQDGGYGSELARLMGTLRAPLWLGRNRLTRAGDAQVKETALTPPRPRPENSGPVLPSPLDALLDALAAGSFSGVASTALKKALSALLDEAGTPLLFPAVVNRTIEQSIDSFHQKIAPLRWLERVPSLTRWLKRVEKYLVHWAYGTDGDLAGRAIHAMARQGDLPRHEVAREVFNYDASAADHRLMMLAMGRDAARGTLEYDARNDRLIADLDLFHLAPGYARQEQLMKDVAKALGGELRTNPAWALLGKPITVHNQGGCPMSDSPEHGVTDEDGQVHGCKGLYVNDGALLCRSVGVNPSATILAIAERNIAAFIEKNPPARRNVEGCAEYERQRVAARCWRLKQTGVVLTPERGPARPLESKPLGLTFTESMQGYYECGEADLGGNDAAYRQAETRGRPDFPMRLDLVVSVANLAAFYEDMRHELAVEGSVTLRLPFENALAPGQQRVSREVAGRLELMVPRDKPYGIPASQRGRRLAHERLAGTYTTRSVRQPPKEQRFLRYYLALSDAPGWYVFGYKRVRDDGGLDAWRDTSSLFVRLYGPESGAAPGSPSVVQGSGVVHVDLTGFLADQLPSLKVGYVPAPGSGARFDEEDDPALVSAATARFAAFFLGSLQRVYLPELKGAVSTLLRAAPTHHGVRR